MLVFTGKRKWIWGSRGLVLAIGSAA